MLDHSSQTLGRAQHPVRKRWLMISDIEPVTLPVDNFGGELVRDVLLLHPLAQLYLGTTNFCYVVLAGLGQTWKRWWKRSKWGFMPKQASQR